MWIYYNYSCGPGHQSGGDGFKYFSSQYNEEAIEEHLMDMVSYKEDVILEFWEVLTPSAKFINKEIEKTKNKIKNLKKYLKIVEKETCYNPIEKMGEDIVLKRNLIRVINSDLLKRLHQKGFMYSEDDISDWRYGKKCLTEPERSKVLTIIRKADRYPDYKLSK